MQGLENTAALDEGSVLCTEGRALLGRVEDVLGPVTQPVYAVRYCGAGALPDGLVARDRVFAVAGRSRVFDASAAAAAGPARDWDVAVEGEEESEEEGGEEGGAAPEGAPAAGTPGKRRRDDGASRPHKLHTARGGRAGGRRGGRGGGRGGRGGGRRDSGPHGIVARVLPGQQPCAPSLPLCCAVTHLAPMRAVLSTQMTGPLRLLHMEVCIYVRVQVCDNCSTCSAAELVRF